MVLQRLSIWLLLVVGVVEQYRLEEAVVVVAQEVLGPELD